MKKLPILLLAFMSIVFVSCNKEKLITLSNTTTTLHHGDTYQISAQCENPITYSSANEYHAKVSNTGLVTAQYVGRTTISLNSEDDNKSFTVIVSPTSNLYQEPNISFGDTRSTVISRLGTPDATMDNSIAYNDYSNAAQMLIVTFKNDRVDYYGVVVKSAYSSELATFLGERYDFIGYSDDIFLYRNGLTENTTTMYVGMTLYNLNYWMLLYMSTDSMKSHNELDKIFKFFEVFD